MKNLLPILTLLVPLMVNAQITFDWGLTFGSDNSDLSGAGLIDHEDNLYVVGGIRDTADLDPGPGQDTLFPITYTNWVLSKFDANGNYLWAARFVGGEEGYAVLLEVKYNMLQVMSAFRDSLVYSIHGNVEYVLHKPGYNIALLTLDLDGQLLESYDFPATPDFFIVDYQTLPNRRILISGSFSDTLNFDPHSNDGLVSNGDADGFIALLNPDKSVVWANSYGSTDYDYTGSFAYHPSGTIYFTAEHDDTVSLQTVDGTVILPASSRPRSFFGTIPIEGGLPRVFNMEGTTGNEIRDIDVDPDGNMYIVGSHEGTINFAHPSQAPYLNTDQENSEGYILKYNAEGLLQWVKIYHNSDYGGVHHVRVKRGNELYITGYLAGTGDIDLSPDSLIINADHLGDAYMAKFDLDGNQHWVYHFGGEDSDGIRNINVSTESAKVIINGYTYGSVDCDPNDGEYFVHTNGGANAFAISLSEENVISGTVRTSSADLQIYPNPASDQVRIHFEQPIDHLLLSQVDGRILQHHAPGHDTEFTMDISPLPSGIYLLTIQSHQNMYTVKMVKE